MTYHILFNPLAGNGKGEKRARRLETILTDGARRYHDLTKLEDCASLLRTLAPEDVTVLTGGDGTINRFLNEVDCDSFPNELLYYATGSGNDFLRDLGKPDDAAPFSLRPYLKALPVVTVNGESRRFLNGIGYGIDGYCCEVGDRLRATTDKPVNYTSIAIKGLLFHYRPVNATVTVDGQTHEFRRVWLAPTMHGRFYGGGMMVTPEQRRGNAEGTVSVCVLHGSGKLKTLLVFPSIFKGEHVKHTDMVTVLEGHDITVRFDRPTALQIDGETILGVTEYRAVAYAGEPVCAAV